MTLSGSSRRKILSKIFQILKTSLRFFTLFAKNIIISVVCFYSYTDNGVDGTTISYTQIQQTRETDTHLKYQPIKMKGPDDSKQKTCKQSHRASVVVI